MTTFEEARERLREAHSDRCSPGWAIETGWPIIDARIAELEATNARLVEENAALLRNSQAAVMTTTVANQEILNGR